MESTFSLGPVQSDGRRYVTESHTADDGRTHKYEWLSDGTLDPQMVMDERAIVIGSIIAQRSAARAAVAGTAVPLTRYEFLARFTIAERVAVRARCENDPFAYDFMDLMRQSGDVSMALARPGLAYLASVGVLTAERAAIIGVD